MKSLIFNLGKTIFIVMEAY